jgi:hypothetical protein
VAVRLVGVPGALAALVVTATDADGEDEPALLWATTWYS